MNRDPTIASMAWHWIEWPPRAPLSKPSGPSNTSSQHLSNYNIDNF